MAKKYGVTTIARWLAEELPQGVKCYIKQRNMMLEILEVVGRNGTLLPVLRPSGVGHMQSRFTSAWSPVTLNTQVVLSLGEELSGKPWDQVSQQLRPLAPDCWALNGHLKAIDSEYCDSDEEFVDSSLYCG